MMSVIVEISVLQKAKQNKTKAKQNKQTNRKPPRIVI